MAKKMSVQEILAAARAEKAGGKPATPPPPAEQEQAPPPTPAAEAPAVPPSESAPAAAPPKPAAKPAGKMSVQEMIAAARAQKGGGAAPAAKPAPAPKPAAEKVVAASTAPKPAAAQAEAKSATAVAPKDTASILAAVRKTAKPGPVSKSAVAAKAAPAAEPVKKKIEVPPMPPKPDYARPRPAASAASQPRTRRGFISALVGFAFGSSLAVGFSSLVITHLMWLLGLARFMFPNILIEPPTRFKVGFPDAYAPGQVETKYIPQFGVWIVRYEYEGQPIIFALKSVCTHLGCTPNWLEAEQKFKCPCHGSGFYKDGINFEGPAPRPLERYAISLADDGQLLVDKSRTFNQELGQWTDPASFIPV